MPDGGLQSDATTQRKAENVGSFKTEMPDQGGDVVRHQLEAQWTLDVGGVSVPLPLFDKNRGNIAGSLAQLDASEARLNAARITRRSRV